MTNLAIRVEHLGKLYRIGRRERYKARRDTLSDALYIPSKNRDTDAQRADGHR